MTRRGVPIRVSWLVLAFAALSACGGPEHRRPPRVTGASATEERPPDSNRAGTLAGEVVFRTRLVNGETGELLPGGDATVETADGRFDRGALVSLELSVRPPPGFVTGDAAHYRLRVRVSRFTFTVVATLPVWPEGSPAGYRETRTWRPGTGYRSFYLSPPRRCIAYVPPPDGDASLEVRVVRRDGRAAPFTQVWVESATGRPAWQDPPVPPRQRGWGVHLDTDARGAGRVTSVPEGPVHVGVDEPGFVLDGTREISLRAATNVPLVLREEEGQSLTVVALDTEDRPVPGASVEVLYRYGNEWLDLSGDVQYVGHFTDREGRVVLSHVPARPGRYVKVARGRCLLVVPAGSEETVVRLRPR